MTAAVTRTEFITPEPAAALAAMLDIDAPSAKELPALWHWVYLLEHRQQRDLGPDGHPTQGIPAPPGPGRLRMFAGGRVSTHRALRFGEPATRTTRVLHTAEKRGRSGPLTFVTVGSEICQDGRLAITDEQDIVYRTPGFTLRAPPNTDPPGTADRPDGSLTLEVSSILLFRFSALTYNAHRIHYDPAYAAQEGYAGLVVHGPLQALMMGESLRRSGVSLVGHEFAYRLIAPMVGEQVLTVVAAGGDSGASARVTNAAGQVTATSSSTPG